MRGKLAQERVRVDDRLEVVHAVGDPALEEDVGDACGDQGGDAPFLAPGDRASLAAPVRRWPRRGQRTCLTPLAPMPRCGR
jgi:hypothetical protein